MIAHNPRHGSGQAGFPHPAVTLGNNAHAAKWVAISHSYDFCIHYTSPV
jgi:hypothetical protein